MSIPGAVTDPSRIHTESVQVRSGLDLIPAYRARAGQPERRPGLIVIHEAFGMVEHIYDLVRRFANLGYDAIAPDLYARTGGPDPSDINSVMERMFALPDAQVVQDLEATAAYLRGLPDASGKVGCIGFCSGGRQTLLFACSSDKADAAIDCWGGFLTQATPDAVATPQRPTPVIDLAERLACPLLAVFGEEDQNPTIAQAEDLRARLERANNTAEIRVYPRAGHAFLADYRPTYREEAAFRLWRDIQEFLTYHLQG